MLRYHHILLRLTRTTPEPEVTPITIESWNVTGGNRFGLPFSFTANFSEPIANTIEQLRTSLDIEGIDIDVNDMNLVGLMKTPNNLQLTVTVTAPEDFTGSISVGIEEDDLRPVE